MLKLDVTTLLKIELTLADQDTQAAYAEYTEYAEYAEYVEYAKFTEHAKYTDWLKQSVPLPFGNVFFDSVVIKKCTSMHIAHMFTDVSRSVCWTSR